jgi:hypothetical protein
VPLVVKPSASARRAERLARAGAGPDGAVVWPAGLAKRVGPDADAREEMALSESRKFNWRDIGNAPFVHHPIGDVALPDQLAQPCGGERIDLVVPDGHVYFSQAPSGVLTSSTITLICRSHQHHNP